MMTLTFETELSISGRSNLGVFRPLRYHSRRRSNTSTTTLPSLRGETFAQLRFQRGNLATDPKNRNRTSDNQLSFLPTDIDYLNLLRPLRYHSQRRSNTSTNTPPSLRDETFAKLRFQRSNPATDPKNRNRTSDNQLSFLPTDIDYLNLLRLLRYHSQRRSNTSTTTPSSLRDEALAKLGVQRSNLKYQIESQS